jgi:hypothetical protein
MRFHKHSARVICSFILTEMSLSSTRLFSKTHAAVALPVTGWYHAHFQGTREGVCGQQGVGSQI